MLASALHLDPLLKQVQGADEALGDLVHFGDPDFYTRTLTLEQDLLGRLQMEARDMPQGAVCKSLSVQVSVENRLKHNY